MTTEIEKTDQRRGWTSASSAAADRLCEGRHQAQLGIPDSTSEDAAFGTKIHDALHKGDPEGLDEQQLQLYEQHQQITEKLMIQFFGPDREAAIVVKENRYWCNVSSQAGGKGDRFRHSGAPDLIARHQNRVLIIEYKSLTGDIPEPSKNEQLRDQAVLVAGNLGIKENCEIGTAVNQPLITHDPELCIYRPDDIKQAEAEMFDRVRKSNNPDAPRTAGTVQCKFCKAKSKCKEYEVWAESLMPVTTKVVGLPTSEWTPDMWAYFLEMRSAPKKWIEDCEAEAKRRLEADPTSIPGWKLEEGATQSVITDPQELYARLINVAAGTESPLSNSELLNLYMDCVKINKTDFQALFRKVTGLKGKELSKKFTDLLAGITEEKKNKSSLGKMTAAEMAAQEPEPEKVVDVS